MLGATRAIKPFTRTAGEMRARHLQSCGRSANVSCRPRQVPGACRLTSLCTYGPLRATMLAIMSSLSLSPFSFPHLSSLALLCLSLSLSLLSPSSLLSRSLSLSLSFLSLPLLSSSLARLSHALTPLSLCLFSRDLPPATSLLVLHSLSLSLSFSLILPSPMRVDRIMQRGVAASF